MRHAARRRDRADASSSTKNSTCGSACGTVNQKIRKERSGASGAALVRAALIRRTGDIEVRPFQSLRELAEKGGRRDGSALAAADVGEIRKIALELLGVLFRERELPGPIVG